VTESLPSSTRVLRSGGFYRLLWHLAMGALDRGGKTVWYNRAILALMVHRVKYDVDICHEEVSAAVAARSVKTFGLLNRLELATMWSGP